MVIEFVAKVSRVASFPARGESVLSDESFLGKGIFGNYAQSRFSSCRSTERSEGRPWLRLWLWDVVGDRWWMGGGAVSLRRGGLQGRLRIGKQTNFGLWAALSR